MDGLTEFEDDVASNSVAAQIGILSESGPISVPDFNYTNLSGNRAIPCPRDLEDYSRLWVSGISTNVLANLPSGSTVELWCSYYWDGYEYVTNGNPTIDLFMAADADGGTGYLTNLATASNQIDLASCPYIGRLGANQEIQLNSSEFSNNWAGNHFIFCGVSNGMGVLNLSIYDGSGNVLAWSQQYIQLVDVKQMYERWTLGDNDENEPLASVAPLTNAVLVSDGEPNGPTTNGGYNYDPAYDTNDDYILYVHGWNEQTWLKDRWAETAFKRLYWQGYQGRFGEFRWPCFNLSADPSGFDTSEWNAWKSGQPLETFLADTLSKNYPNHVYLLAHSQGNVVVGEALRLATNKLVKIFVASQAALSARAYDNTLAANATNYYTLATSDPQGNYYTNGAPSYFNISAGAGRYVNFYNPNDYALMGDSLNPFSFHPGWLKDQSLKPDTAEYYYYTTPTPTIPSGYYIHVTPVARSGLGTPTNALYFPTNTYQIFAMCAQSYSLALGTQVGVGSPFTTNAQVDLSEPPYNFGNQHIQHDEEFTYDNMITSPYWLSVLQSYGLK